jgi:anaerobic selenocysteine-containing dehydrogenase
LIHGLNEGDAFFNRLGATVTERTFCGGILQFPVWEHANKFDVICRPDWISEGTRVINALQSGRALTDEPPAGPPIKSIMCWNANPVTQAPETDKIVEGLKNEDLFLVSAEHFISDTALYADILLPASMGVAEMEDMILSWGRLYLTYNAKCVESPGEAIPNNEIFRRLAARFGYEEANFKWSDAENHRRCATGIDRRNARLLAAIEQ